MPRKRPRKDPLSRDRVVSVAVALADTRGIESLSMRSLARKLRVVPMALYRHVENKEDLLDHMIDVVFGEVGFVSNGADWRTDMRERASAMREALLRHRWAIGLMESRTRPGPANLRHHDAVVGRLLETGFPLRTALRAYHTMDSYIYGSLLQQNNLPFETPAEFGEVAAEIMASSSLAEEYPHLVEVVVELTERGFDYREGFEAGLDLVLDAIERLRQQEAAAVDSG